MSKLKIVQPHRRIKEMLRDGWTVLSINASLPSVQRIGFNSIYQLQSPTDKNEQVCIFV